MCDFNLNTCKSSGDTKACAGLVDDHTCIKDSDCTNWNAVCTQYKPLCSYVPFNCNRHSGHTGLSQFDIIASWITIGVGITAFLVIVVYIKRDWFKSILNRFQRPTQASKYYETSEREHYSGPESPKLQRVERVYPASV
jgi:hypothetical protein